MSEGVPPKVVGLDGAAFGETELPTGADIIKVLEDTLQAARDGRMTAVAIATIMQAGRCAGTIQLCEHGYHTEMLGCIDIMKQRLRNRILDDSL